MDLQHSSVQETVTAVVAVAAAAVAIAVAVAAAVAVALAAAVALAMLLLEDNSASCCYNSSWAREDNLYSCLDLPLKGSCL